MITLANLLKGKKVAHANKPLLSLGLSFVLSFSVVSVANGDCYLSNVGGVKNDRHLYPTSAYKNGQKAFVCGKGYCDNEQELYVYSNKTSFLGTKSISANGGTYLATVKCKQGFDDKWEHLGSKVDKCKQDSNYYYIGGSFVDYYTLKDGQTVTLWGSRKYGDIDVYDEMCYVPVDVLNTVKCDKSKDGGHYLIPDTIYLHSCHQGSWKFSYPVEYSCTEKPTGWGWNEVSEVDGAVLFSREKPPVRIEDTGACVWCENGGIWDYGKGECIKTETPPTTTSKKTVEERCKERNGNVKCSPERLECYKKGSATKWKDGKCECTDKNKIWKYENNIGQCVEKKTEEASDNTNLCKTKIGDLKIGEYSIDVALENCKDVDKTEGNVQIVASWEIICETGAKVVCKPYTCIDGYELNSEKDKCIVKDTAELDKAKEIEKAKRVVKEFFNTTQNNRNVWRNADGNFNTARLASDVTAGVVLGTVGGVVSGVVIKKKQVEKGFDAIRCVVGGQTVAGWGDTFRVGFIE